MSIRNGMRFLIISLLLPVMALPAAASQSVAALRLTGDQRITLPISLESLYTGSEQTGIGNYCVRLEQAESRQQNWQVHLLSPEGGYVLRPLDHNGPPLPIEISVQDKLNAPAKPVRHEQIIYQGTTLTGHCGHRDNRFRITIKPTQSLVLLKGGRYQQRLRLQLTSKDIFPVNLDILLVLNMPELASAKVEKRTISLPPFDGRTPPVATTSLCLFRNGGGQYTVRLRGDGPNDQFLLKGVDLLEYQVFWQADNRTRESLSPGRFSNVYSGSAFRDCRGRYNAALQVELPVNEAEKAHSGNYQGSLRITVQAQ